jgi:hypothetical protein
MNYYQLNIIHLKIYPPVYTYPAEIDRHLQANIAGSATDRTAFIAREA